MAGLDARDLLKKGNEFKIAIILEKIKTGKKIQLTNGKKIIFENQPENIKTLQKNKLSLRELTNIVFRASDTKEYTIKDIKDNEEFFNVKKKTTTLKEEIAIRHINAQLNMLKTQLASNYVPIKIKNRIVEVTGAISTPGTPKSDFHFLDTKGKEHVWISHKDGSKPYHFQQWSGISAMREPWINRHKETQEFIKDLLNAYPDGLPRATTLTRKIKDKKLKMKAVYGQDFGKTQNRQNVSTLIQGMPTIKKAGSSFKIESANVHYNGDSLDHGGFEPVFMAQYRSDRKDGGLKNTRITISPIGSQKSEMF